MKMSGPREHVIVEIDSGAFNTLLTKQCSATPVKCMPFRAVECVLHSTEVSRIDEASGVLQCRRGKCFRIRVAS